MSAIDNRRAGLRPPQFGLRSLLLLTAACGVVLALIHWGLQPIAVVGLLFLAASIVCHVAGNAIGTRLREIGDRTVGDSGQLTASSLIRPQPHEFAPATQLSQRRSLGWTIVVSTLVGVVAGGLGGGLWTWLGSNGEVQPLNVGVGVTAFATLGGIAAFATVGFIVVLFGAVWQAMKPAPTVDQRTKLLS